jgi:Glycosyl hydrolase family 20, domain 2
MGICWRPSAKPRITASKFAVGRYATGRGRRRSLVLFGVPVLLGALIYSAHATMDEVKAGSADPADRYPGLNLIPWPRAVRLDAGRMNLTAESRIVPGQEELKPLAEVLSGEIVLLTGLKLKVAADASRPGDIVLKIDRTIQAGGPILMLRNRQPVRPRDGAHRLTIGDRAVVEGFDYCAVAEGSATLLQALGQSAGQVRLPKLAIQDWPHADYCAQMVDVGRQNRHTRGADVLITQDGTV